jgi:hypothetical protein
MDYPPPLFDSAWLGLSLGSSLRRRKYCSMAAGTERNDVTCRVRTVPFDLGSLDDPI